MDDEIGIGGVAAIVGAIIGVIVVIWLIVFGFSAVGARATPQAGEIGVVRSGPSDVWIGDWFNGHQIKKVIASGAGSTYIGLGSKVHYYPSDTVQRQYTISSDPNQGDQVGVDYVQVPTSDGINVRLDGSFYFTTAFNNSPEGEALVKDFDNRFGVRQFGVSAANGDQYYPWQGSDGFEAFLNTVVRPIINNDLRTEIAQYTCSELYSPCALVENGGTKTVSVKSGAKNTAVLTKIQNSINSSLEEELAQKLGKDYFSDISFLLSDVSPPTQIQNQIDQAQANFAAVSSEKAAVQKAKLAAEANREQENGYEKCPACAAIDELKAIPSNVTTFAPGSGFAITAK